MVELICLGEPMVEFNQRPDGLFQQGFGGDTSNCAVAAARQGARVGYVTRLGTDLFGDRLLALWHSEGIDTALVQRDPEHPTAVYCVTHDRAGHHFSYCRKGSAASRMKPSMLRADYIAAARYLHVSGISEAISPQASACVRQAVELAVRSGVRVSYDTNLRLALWPLDKAKSVIHETMRRCQVALPSYDDAVALTGLRQPDAIIDFYLALGADTVALKMGAQGAIVAAGGRRRVMAGINTAAVDCNAAGDTFAGVFLAALLQGSDPFSAGARANRAAAISTAAPGAVASIPGRDRVAAALPAAG